MGSDLILDEGEAECSALIEMSWGDGLYLSYLT
jgi:hypothetical protein